MRSLLKCLGIVTFLAIASCGSDVVGGSPPDPAASSCNHIWACGKPSLGMASPQNPSATPTFPTTITPPANGDPLDAQQLNIDVETPLQNGVEAARLMLYGGGVKRRVKCVSNTVITIQPLGAVLVTVGGVWTVKQNLTVNTFDPSAGLAANQRYWVYASIVGNVLTFSKSVDAPDAGLLYRNGADTDYLWVSTFVTDSTANIAWYTQTDLQFTYDQNPLGSDILHQLDNGSAVATTTVPLNAAIPTAASSFSFFGLINATALGRCGIISNSAGGTDVYRICDSTPIQNRSQGSISLAYAHSFDYVVTNAATQLSVIATGFTL